MSCCALFWLIILSSNHAQTSGYDSNCTTFLAGTLPCFFFPAQIHPSVELTSWRSTELPFVLGQLCGLGAVVVVVAVSEHMQFLW